MKYTTTIDNKYNNKKYLSLSVLFSAGGFFSQIQTIHSQNGQEGDHPYPPTISTRSRTFKHFSSFASETTIAHI